MVEEERWPRRRRRGTGMIQQNKTNAGRMHINTQSEAHPGKSVTHAYQTHENARTHIYKAGTHTKTIDTQTNHG